MHAHPDRSCDGKLVSVDDEPEPEIERCEVYQHEADATLHYDNLSKGYDLPLSRCIDDPDWYGLEWVGGHTTLAGQVMAWRDNNGKPPVAVLFRKDPK